MRLPHDRPWTVGPWSARVGSRSRLAVLTLAAVIAVPAGAVPAHTGRRAPQLRVIVSPFRLLDRSAAPDTAAMRLALAPGGVNPERLLADAFVATGRYALAGQNPADAAAVQTGVATSYCATLSCAVELGRSLAAERVVIGTIEKISGIIWNLSVALVDLPGGAMLHEESVEVKGNIADLLPKVMTALARRLASHDTTSGARSMGRADVERLLSLASAEAPADLSAADLSGADLSGLDFKRANLAHAQLVGANLSRANLFGVSLEGANARDANLTGAVLDVAVVRDADLSRALLRGASLYATIGTGATFNDADLSGTRVIAALANAKLVRTKLVDARFGADPSNQPMGVMRTDLTGADLSGADLTRADLRKALLIRADLTGADLTDADVSGADLSGAVLVAIRGRDRIRNLDRARNVEQAVFSRP